MRATRALTTMVAIVALAGCGKRAQDRTATTGVGKVDGALLANGGDGRDWAMTGFDYTEDRFCR